MCGRYYIDTDDSSDELMSIVERAKEQSEKTEHILKVKTGEIFISDIVPVIALSKNSAIKPFAMKWGFTGYDKKKIIFNARSETANEKPMFVNGMNSRRCVVPASGYYEWQKTNVKSIKYKIYLKQSDVVYMAGKYRYEEDPKLPRFVILTKPACSQITFIHDRMPVILDENGMKEWLSYRNVNAPNTEHTDLEITMMTA